MRIGIALWLWFCSVAWAGQCEFGNFKATYLERFGGKEIGIMHDSFVVRGDQYVLQQVLQVDAMLQQDQITNETQGRVAGGVFSALSSRVLDAKTNKADLQRFPAGVYDLPTVPLQLRLSLLRSRQGTHVMPKLMPVWWNNRYQNALIRVADEAQSLTINQQSVSTTKVTLTADAGDQVTYWFDVNQHDRLVKTEVMTRSGARTDLELLTMTHDDSACISELSG